jgi:hypothetical protein
MKINYSAIAKELGRRGGLKRAKNLSAERKKEIAQMGAKARAESILIARRIRINFAYADAVRKLAPPRPKVISSSTCDGKLPGIHDND